MPLVTNGRIAGFAWEPGRQAGYRAGRSLRYGGCRHITAGACGGDRSVLTNLGGAYCPKSPGCGPGRTQFAEIDAVSFTQCEWNAQLMAVEVEKRTVEELMTPYQIESVGLWVAGCIELGVARTDNRIDGPGRFGLHLRASLRGFVDHRDLEHRSCDQHSDGWPLHEWHAVLAAADRWLGETGPPVDWAAIAAVVAARRRRNEEEY